MPLLATLVLSGNGTDKNRCADLRTSCARQGLEPVQQFRLEVSNNFHGDLKGPFNITDRARAVSRTPLFPNIHPIATR